MVRQIAAPVLGSLGWSSAVALAPILVLFLLLGVLGWRAERAAGAALAAALLVAVGAYGVGIGPALDMAALGALFGLVSVAWVILNALWIYDVTLRSGHFEALRHAFARAGGPLPVQVLLIAYGFGGLLEGLIGAGAPVAITVAPETCEGESAGGDLRRHARRSRDRAARGGCLRPDRRLRARRLRNAGAAGRGTRVGDRAAARRAWRDGRAADAVARRARAVHPAVPGRRQARGRRAFRRGSARRDRVRRDAVRRLELRVGAARRRDGRPRRLGGHHRSGAGTSRRNRDPDVRERRGAGDGARAHAIRPDHRRFRRGAMGTRRMAASSQPRRLRLARSACRAARRDAGLDDLSRRPARRDGNPSAARRTSRGWGPARPIELLP